MGMGRISLQTHYICLDVCRFVVLTGPVRALQVRHDVVAFNLPRRLYQLPLLAFSRQRRVLRSINADDGGTLFCVPSQGAFHHFHQKNKDAWKH
jgi:hypothetical protein